MKEEDTRGREDSAERHRQQKQLTRKDRQSEEGKKNGWANLFVVSSRANFKCKFICASLFGLFAGLNSVLTTIPVVLTSCCWGYSVKICLPAGLSPALAFTNKKNLN